MNARQLKNAILQQAIEGRLVPQNPDDEPAAVLLERIRAEKARLVAEGKCRKQKPLPPISEEEKPFALPKGWAWVRLGEVGFWTAGATPSRNIKEFYGGGIPWLKTGDLTDGYINEVPETITKLALANCSLSLLPKGTVLIAMYGATIGKLGILKFPATTNQACCGCIPFSEIHNKWIFYFLFSQKRNFQKLAEGGAQPNISKEKIIKLPVPLPPLAEQKRIVAKLEELLPEVDAYGQAQEALSALEAALPDRLRKSLLQEAVRGRLVPQNPDDEPAAVLLERIRAEKARLVAEGKCRKQKPLPPISEEEKPFALPKGWEWVRLGEIGETCIGITYSPAEIAADGIPVLRSNNIFNGKINFDNIVYINKKIPKHLFLNKGDILICARNGSKALVGKSAIIENEGMSFGAFMACYKSPCNLYVHFFLMSPVFRKKLDATTTTTINQLTQQVIKNTLIPLPPLAEQQRIVAKLEELLPLCDGAGSDVPAA